MGKITNALKKAADERVERVEKISKIKSRDKLIIKQMSESNVDPSIVTYFDSKALITEQYKILRTNLLSMNKGNPPRMFVVTSSLHSEGKTVTALNLAISIAHAVSKPRVVIIDADLRRGRLAKYLGVQREVGLAEVLQGNATLEDALFQLENDNISFMSCGQVPENPAELLDSQPMHKLMANLKNQYDYVIIDTPPVVAVTDSGIIGAKCDGVLMVIQAGRTQRGIVRRSEELLNQAHTKIIGHVLTNIEYHLPEYIYRYL